MTRAGRVRDRRRRVRPRGRRRRLRSSALRGPAIVVLGAPRARRRLGLHRAAAASTSTAPSACPLVFLLMGPLMVVGAYFAVSGAWSPDGARPVDAGRAAGRGDPARQRVARHQRGHAGGHRRRCRRGSARRWAHYGYVALVLGAYIVARRWRSRRPCCPLALLAILSLPFLAQVDPLRRARRHRPGAGDRDDRPPDGPAPPRVRRLLVLGIVLARLVGGDAHREAAREAVPGALASGCCSRRRRSPRRSAGRATGSGSG